MHWFPCLVGGKKDTLYAVLYMPSFIYVRYCLNGLSSLDRRSSLILRNPCNSWGLLSSFHRNRSALMRHACVDCQCELAELGRLVSFEVDVLLDSGDYRRGRTLEISEC